MAETREHYFTRLVELEWLVHSILGDLLEGLFSIVKKIYLNLIVRLCTMNHVVISQILSILEER